jgi:hypothetical protein
VPPEGIDSTSNEQVYAAGLLNRAVDPATQPPEIRAFLKAEIDLLNDIVVEGMSMIDVGCGTDAISPCCAIASEPA